jgi:ketosteroid isomerase-like protein
MNEQRNIDLVKQCYDAFQKKDIQRLLSCCADDIDWDLPQIEDIPLGGKRHGIAQVAEFFQMLDQLQAVRDFRPQEFTAQGDRVLVTGTYTFTVKATSADYTSDWCHCFTIANGKIARFKEYIDTHQVALAYQQAAAARGVSAGAGTRPSVH